MTEPKTPTPVSVDDARSALAALAAQLASRAATARPMRTSMERAYRTVIEREHARLTRRSSGT